MSTQRLEGKSGRVLRGVGCGGERERKSAHTLGRERESALAPPFICFFLPLGLAYVSGVSQECCLFYLRSSFQSSELALFYFRGLFPSLSFSHRHFGLLFPILTT